MYNTDSTHVNWVQITYTLKRPNGPATVNNSASKLCGYYVRQACVVQSEDFRREQATHFHFLVLPVIFDSNFVKVLLWRTLINPFSGLSLPETMPAALTSKRM